MDLLGSREPVRRILLLSVVLGVLILAQGSVPPSRDSKPVPRSARPLAAAKKVPPPPRHEREFPNFEGQSSGLSFAKDEVHVYLFDLEPDDFVDIEVGQQGVDVTANVYGPGEPPVKVDRWNGDSGPENIPLLAEVAGHYRVELTGGVDGTYQILIHPKRKATVRDRQNAEGALAYSRGTALKGGITPNLLAEQEFGKALAAWKVSGFQAGQADAAYELERLVAQRKSPSAALPLLEQALALYRGLGNRHQEAIILNGLGMAHDELGEMDQPLSYYDRALKLARTIKDRDLESGILFNRGMLYSKASEFGKALKDLDSALAIRQTLPGRLDEAKALNALGNTYSLLDQTDLALSFYKRALEILKEHRDPYVEGLTFAGLGDVYQRKGNAKRAIEHYQRSFALLQNTGHAHEETTTLNNLAIAYFSAGRHQEALNAFQHCQRIFETHGETSEAAVAWTNIGWVLAAMKRYKDASEAYDRALSTVHGRKRPILEVEAYHGLAWTEWRRGSLNSARVYLDKSLSAMEALRTRSDRAELRSSFLAGRQGLYDLLVEILMEQHRREPAKGYDIQALAVSERARSRTLLDELEGRPVLPSLSVHDIQRQVLDAGDVVLLEYFLGEKRSYLWVVTSSSFSSYELPASGTRIAALAREVHGLQEESHKLEFRSKAIRKSIDLSRLLFGQVADRLQGKRLLIVAPPALQYISFGALPEDMRESRSQGSIWPRPWIVNHEVTVEFSATVLATLRRLHEGRSRPAKTIAILADPVFSPADERLAANGPRGRSGEKVRFSRLKYSRSEVAAIEAQARQGKPFLALGFDASRQRVLDGILKGYSHLHFSTHGMLDSENPDRSAIVLSLVDRNGRPVEGELRAGEISKLELSADLVVLSACKTGLGREIRGEGLVGLTQAFFSAGASRVTVSLWDVDDQATAVLMGRFYQNLFQENLPPAAALKEAQVWMWKQPRWNAPYYWGGFVLQGEWK